MSSPEESIPPDKKDNAPGVVLSGELKRLREERLDTILYGSEKLLKLKLIYPDDQDNKLEKTIRIIATKNL